jgi:hypothetical protein
MAYEKIGGWAFILGVVIALVAGLITGQATGQLRPYDNIITALLVVLGLVVGFLNIGEKEVNDFLIAAIAVSLIGQGQANLAAIEIIGNYLKEMVVNIVTFVAPAALVVALKSVYSLARKPS